MKMIEDHACFSGSQKVFQHHSQCLDCDMKFAIFLPQKAKTVKLPVLYWLSGLTCTEQNFITKSAMQLYAARNNLIVVAADTSPRGENIADAESYDLGQGAGFYLNATQKPWDKHYQMYDYILHELPELIEKNFPTQSQKSIFGHSMGGLGALVLALRNPEHYVSVSAFSPIVTPSNVPWGQKAFSNYLGENTQDWAKYDPNLLVLNGRKVPEILLDQGLADPFFETQLQTNIFEESCKKNNIKTTFRYHENYDHSYYFIASFIADHMAYHAIKLFKGVNIKAT